jgi:hypothetical protein
VRSLACSAPNLEIAIPQAHWLGLPGNAPGYAMVRHGSDDYHEHWLKEPAFKLDDVLAGLIQATPNDGTPSKPVATSLTPSSQSKKPEPV